MKIKNLYNSTLKKYEKIFINQRIRDLKFSEKLNSIILTLEDKQELGIFKVKINK